MKHVSPQPLKTAMDLVKRFNMDLAAKMTPEQRRDFSRLQALLEEADRVFTTQLSIQNIRAGVGAALSPRGY